MGTSTTKDGTELYYKGRDEGPVVTFSHGWPLNADMWDGQMLFLVHDGFCTAHDRRGHVLRAVAALVARPGRARAERLSFISRPNQVAKIILEAAATVGTVGTTAR
jgi:pimeloyl-ACP methyl ester carboxylesterase